MTRANAADNTKPSGPSTETVQWVEQARQGDQTAFHRLVDRYQPEIFRMIYYRTRSRLDAEDLTQDVFLRAYKHLQRLESAEGFRSWLFRIAVNRVHDHHRSLRVKSIFGIVSMDEETFRETEEMAVAPEAADGMARKEFWQQVNGILTVLSRMEREVFMLRFFDQLSIREMADAMKKNESTIKTHLYRALAKVKTAAMQNGLWEAT
ncbi:MAG: RNA polymerase sigma factor [Desulfatitalea sp.]|nr:RNA polymerase sigma factor [Desulfatitalea sp.]NNK00532.1 RNA polymerase sigma factor [Desulfatitalea sp.]